MKENKKLTSAQCESLLEKLRERFDKHANRHPGVSWGPLQAKLEANPEKMWSLNSMEASGGEPDVVGFDETTGMYLFCDCSAESPAGRRNLCYDREALEARKANKPIGSAVDAAAAMGAELLTEEQYRALQELGEFDAKTSSWVATPRAIRERGGALFCDRRYGHVFTYHNGAESYYSVRGFRAALWV